MFKPRLSPIFSFECVALLAATTLSTAQPATYTPVTDAPRRRTLW
jgi:hypothetical protein